MQAAAGRQLQVQTSPSRPVLAQITCLQVKDHAEALPDPASMESVTLRTRSASPSTSPAWEAAKTGAMSTGILYIAGVSPRGAAARCTVRHSVRRRRCRRRRSVGGQPSPLRGHR